MTNFIKRIHNFFFEPTRNSYMSEAAILKGIICFHSRSIRRALKFGSISCVFTDIIPEFIADLRDFFSLEPVNCWLDEEPKNEWLWNEEERNLLFKYYSNDLTLSRAEFNNAEKLDDLYESNALRCEVSSFVEVDELWKEAQPFREANKAFAATILRGLNCKPKALRW